MCLILKHTSLAQYGMSHLAKGMVVPVIGSLVVSLQVCKKIRTGVSAISSAIINTYLS